ncbi:GH1 family beta-glucosidase [Actinokineospora soli]|uniref:Beta-glucosidase n=1 Tax=Actinokineospora soli TaxID=1048753 RepID=A0ABW2TWS4_9PSEU
MTDHADLLGFPADFRWGAATSAYQIEGAAADGGRKPSIWDTFARTPGKVAGGETGDIAVEHYKRFPEDVALMAELGLRAYRFSLSWARLQPDGRGPANPEGVAFYRRLLETLSEHGIEPVATLYHWDLPQALEDNGGWLNRDTAYAFAEYAALAHECLGDLVQTWVTVNEPWCAAFLGYSSGVHAPGKQDPPGALRAAHHLLLAHGLANQRIKAGPHPARVGLAPNFYPVDPLTDSVADAGAAHLIDLLQNRLFLEPVMKGYYADDIRKHVEQVCGTEHIRPGDEAIIGEPIEFVGVNYYSVYRVSAGTATGEPTSWPGAEDVEFHRYGTRTTHIGWDVAPDGLLRTLERIGDEYPDLPIYITENGAAYDDVAGEDGRVDDFDRVEFLRDHFAAVHEALQRGVDVRGYFLWSLLDNFEWAEGYRMRFGIVHVDYATQRRTRKASADYYAEVIRANGVRR